MSKRNRSQEKPSASPPVQPEAASPVADAATEESVQIGQLVIRAIDAYRKWSSLSDSFGESAKLEAKASRDEAVLCVAQLAAVLRGHKIQ